MWYQSCTEHTMIPDQWTGWTGWTGWMDGWMDGRDEMVLAVPGTWCRRPTVSRKWAKKRHQASVPGVRREPGPSSHESRLVRAQLQDDSTPTRGA